MLREVALRLPSLDDAVGISARVGGDEFVLGVVTTNAAAAVEALVRQIDAALAQPLSAGGHTLMVSASIGAAHCAVLTDPDELLREADRDMYEAKRSAGSSTSVLPLQRGQRLAGDQAAEGAHPSYRSSARF